MARHFSILFPSMTGLRRAAFYVQVEVRRFPQIKGLPSAVIQVIAFVPLIVLLQL